QRARGHRQRPGVAHDPRCRGHHPRVHDHAPRSQSRVGAHLRGYERGAPAGHRAGAARTGGLPMIHPRALEGVRVADFGRVLAVPYATMLMADLGAEVIKVERPDGGDEPRAWGPPWSDEGESTYFLAVNRNKESRVLDL